MCVCVFTGFLLYDMEPATFMSLSSNTNWRVYIDYIYPKSAI